MGIRHRGEGRCRDKVRNRRVAGEVLTALVRIRN